MGMNKDICKEYADGAAFLWVLRSIAVTEPHYSREDLQELEVRIEAQLEGLAITGNVGWEHCKAVLALGEPGGQFTSTVVAFRSHDVHKIQTVVETGLSNPRATKGLISAMGWLGPEITQQWIGKFLNGKDLNHKYLGVAACSVRREDPGEMLTTVLKRDDCLKHAQLQVRALRLAGELRRHDLKDVLQASLFSKEPSIAFWANWSSILLGQRALVRNLQPMVFSPGPLQARAIQIAFRVLPIEQAREWISSLAKDPASVRVVITATGVLGDPHAAGWLIGKMADPALARLAAESFTNITGVDLVKHGLNKDPPDAADPIPTNDATNGHGGTDEDENLPWPDIEKLTALWRNQGGNFRVGQRYFLGNLIAPDWLKHMINAGNMRQRHAAALELALLDPQSRFINTHTKVLP